MLKKRVVELVSLWSNSNKNLVELVNLVPKQKRREFCGWIDHYYNHGGKELVQEEGFIQAVKRNINDISNWNSEIYAPYEAQISSEITSLIKPAQVEEGVHMCKSCKSKRTMSISVQTRSGDEAMTQFISCTNCGKRWREN